jgi:hypothetical protein
MIKKNIILTVVVKNGHIKPMESKKQNRLQRLEIVEKV